MRIGAVAIGRNEGERLVRCLASLVRECAPVVYVDSGSTDGSVEHARRVGVEVVELDMDVPFTAARARNAGLRRLVALAPDAAFVQLVDGDCELQPRWLAAAAPTLEADPALAVVCGRRRERFPEASIYNRLCDIEWDTPVGDALACGGDALVRVDAVLGVGGFRDDLICGEEPELCVRLRRAGHRIRRIDAEMTLHDVDMHRFEQWWRRTERSGYAYAAGAWLHGRSPERHFVREATRIWVWGVGVPLAATAGALPTLGASLLLFGGYPLSAWRAYRAARRQGHSQADAGAYGVFTTLGRLPELKGTLRFHAERLARRRARLIEYK